MGRGLQCLLAALAVLACSAEGRPLMVEWALCAPGVANYTRADIWDYCFMGLGGRASPRPGALNTGKIQGFLNDHLYWYERWVAPSAGEVVARCDGSVPRDGWIERDEFLASTNPACLGDTGSICSVRDVCSRELLAANLPLQAPSEE